MQLLGWRQLIESKGSFSTWPEKSAKRGPNY